MLSSGAAQCHRESMDLFFWTKCWLLPARPLHLIWSYKFSVMKIIPINAMFYIISTWPHSNWLSWLKYDNNKCKATINCQTFCMKNPSHAPSFTNHFYTLHTKVQLKLTLFRSRCWLDCINFILFFRAFVWLSLFIILLQYNRDCLFKE